MCDPLSIQGQSERGSNYCKTLCVLSAERRRKKEKKREQQREQQQQPSTQVICRSLNPELHFKLMKTFLSTVASQLYRAHLPASTLPPRPPCTPSSASRPERPSLKLDWTRRGCGVLIKWRASQR